MELPQEAWDIYRQVAERFKHLHASSNDDDRREANKRGVQTLRARLKGAGPLDGRRYFCKTEHSNGWAAASKDAVAFTDTLAELVHGNEIEMFMFDMINGTSRQINAHPIRSHNKEDGNLKAYALVPDAFDWLAGEAPVDPQPPPEPGREPNPVQPGQKHPWWRGDDEPRPDCSTPLTTGGDCDKPREDPIHDVAVPGPGPVDPGPVNPGPTEPKPVPNGEIALLQEILKELRRGNDRLDRIFKP